LQVCCLPDAYFGQAGKISETLFWVTLYQLGKNGNTCHEHIGAGQYEETESAILRVAGRIIIIIRRKK